MIHFQAFSSSDRGIVSRVKPSCVAEFGKLHPAKSIASRQGDDGRATHTAWHGAETASWDGWQERGLSLFISSSTTFFDTVSVLPSVIRLLPSSPRSAHSVHSFATLSLSLIAPFLLPSKRRLGPPDLNPQNEVAAPQAVRPRGLGRSWRGRRRWLY